MFQYIRQKYSDPVIWILNGISIAVSLFWGFFSDSFSVGFLDGLTLCCALCLLAGGVINHSFGSGYSFMCAQKKTGKKVSELMDERYREERNRKNPALFAGLFLLGLLTVSLLIYLM